MPKVLKIVVFGCGGVGKTALSLQFVEGRFIQRYDPTIEESFRRSMEIDDELYNLEILDTAGTSSFTTMRELYIKKGHGFILVYSITSPSTFNDLNSYIYDHIKKYREGTVPMVLVGNKCDLEDERRITMEEGNELARQYGANFFEASAKNNVNVENIFFDVCQQIVRTLPTKEKNEGCQLM